MRSLLVTTLAFIPACFPTSGSSKSPGGSDGAAAKVSKRPFVVNWAPTERTALETAARDGAVVLAWDRNTGEADVLSRCRLETSPYRFVGASHARQVMTTTTAAELGVHFPFSGPVNLGAELQAHGQINVEYHTIGEYKLDVDTVASDDLEGQCAGATHVVVAMSMGAFKLFAGKEVGGKVSADVPVAAGASGGASKKTENLDQGGDPDRCDAATRTAEEPADGCDSVLAIELLTVEQDSAFVAGERWEGHYECQNKKAVSAMTVEDVREDGTVRATIEFDYASTQGSFLAEGKPTDDGQLTLTFVEWVDQPSGFVAVTPVGIVDAAKGEYSGELEEDACGPFSYVRRTP